MFRIFASIAIFAKRLDAHLTRGVEIRGRRLAGLKPLATAWTRGYRLVEPHWPVAR
ncbi:hypothetical protein ACFPOB_03275 [Bosea eneae]|jgi:hypothetical protein|uniref:Uncharacterized protein n=1 Tax=Bosea eneae TaxID=151454 RepID=A0ABW0IMX1_9HYPH